MALIYRAILIPSLSAGGGVAGLVAATELKKNGIPFLLREGGPRVGGLAQTFTDEQGYKYDFGAHIITNRLAQRLGVEGECRDVDYFGESVWLSGKSYSYPFGLLRNYRFLTSALAGKMNPASYKKPVSLRDKFRHDYGPQFAEDVAVPLAEALTGADANEPAPTLSNKLPGILNSVYLRLAGSLMGRAVAIGYCQERPESSHVWHVYPREGILTLCNKLFAPVEDSVRLQSPVEQIVVENDWVTGVRTKGTFIPASVVINTVPVNVLPRLVAGTDKLNYLTDFRYSTMAFVNIMIDGGRALPNVVLWTPARRLPFFRLNEPSRSMPWITPEGKSMITADVGCLVGDENWERSEEDWRKIIMPCLEEIVPGIGRRILGCKVLKTKYAYPVYLKRYEKARVKFAKNTGIEGLFSIGRNGEFAHILMEDVYFRTKRMIDKMIARMPRRVEVCGGSTMWMHHLLWPVLDTTTATAQSLPSNTWLWSSH